MNFMLKGGSSFFFKKTGGGGPFRSTPIPQVLDIIFLG